MKIISGSTSLKLAAQLAKLMHVELLNAEISKFGDGELNVIVHGDITDDVIIVQSTSHPVNDNLMELLLLADTAKRAGARNITAIIPYLAYTRQNIAFAKNSTVSISLVIKMLEAAGITKVITLDLHSRAIEGMFNIPVCNLETTSLFVPVIEDKKNIIIVSPDIGGMTRAKTFSQKLGVNLAILNKSRDTNNECTVDGIIGDVKDKNCFIIDDIIDSGGTICIAAELLQTEGARSVRAMITHGVLSGIAIDKINASALERLYITDSINLNKTSEKITILPIIDLLYSQI